MLQLKKKYRDFAIIFRSFGKDLEKVVSEWNRFCDGTHPCYNGQHNQQQAKFDGSKNNKNKNFIITPMKTGILYRKSKHIDEAVLVLGTMKRISNPKGDMQQQYQERGEDVKIYKGKNNIHLAIMENLKEVYTKNQILYHFKKVVCNVHSR